MTKYKPQERVWDEGSLHRFEEGHVVGNIAKGYLGDYVEVTSYTEDGELDFTRMITLTKQYLSENKENICEAAFSWNGLYCAVDVLHREADGYAIYEVKSSTSIKDTYIIDVAYQKYVLEGCGIKVTGTYVLFINKEYVRKGDLNPTELFCKQNVWDAVCLEQANISDVLTQAKHDLAQTDEPNQPFTTNCEGCCYLDYCSRNLPQPDIFESHFSSFKKKLSYYHNGVYDLEYLKDKLEIEYVDKHPRSQKVENAYVDKEAVASFLSELHYPLYFLDFETIKPIVPLYEDTKPNQQIPFQYSLHYIEQEGGELQHKEFLAASGMDPRRAITERLATDIPTNACVLAYNMSFERGCIKSLAEAFPDLAPHLMEIHKNFRDLMIPFKNQTCFNRMMEGSYSIKYVLPALFPDDPSLNYHNLEGVHNGGEAMSIFPKIATMSPEDAQKARQNLLKYCFLNTFAMVKIWQKIIMLSK